MLSDHFHSIWHKKCYLWEHYKATHSEGGGEYKVSNICDGVIEVEMVPTHLETTDKAVDRAGTMLVSILLPPLGGKKSKEHIGSHQ